MTNVYYSLKKDPFAISEFIKNKRKIWCWFLLIIFLILACRAAYVTGNGAGQTRDDEVKEEQVKNEAIQDEMEKLC